MLRSLIFGFIIATLSSIVVGVFLNYFYSFKFDESIKILPIWKVVLAYFILSLVFSVLAFFLEKFWKHKGLFVFNAIISFSAVALIGFPIKYTNTEIDTSFFPIVAIPCLFILPIIWLSFQPLVFIKR